MYDFISFVWIALPGADGNVQDEESEAGGGGLQPLRHHGPRLLPGYPEKDLRSADGAHLHVDMFGRD